MYETMGPRSTTIYTISCSLSQFLDETNVRIAPSVRLRTLPAGVAQSRLGAFILNGRAAGAGHEAMGRIGSVMMIRDGKRVARVGR